MIQKHKLQTVEHKRLFEEYFNSFCPYKSMGSKTTQVSLNFPKIKKLEQHEGEFHLRELSL